VATIPNGITLLRIVLSPGISWFILESQWEYAFAGVALAGFSDWLDGYIARECGQKSKFGAFLDPLADKILVTAVALPMAVQGCLPHWLVGSILLRDASLVAGSIFLHMAPVRSKDGTAHEFHVRPSVLSKVNTGLQMTLLGGGLSSAAWGLPTPDTFSGLCYVTGATTWASGLDYLRRAAYFVRSRQGRQ